MRYYLLCFVMFMCLGALALDDLAVDSYPPEPVDWQEDAAPDGTLPGTECPNEVEWTQWRGCEPAIYGDD